MKKKSNVVPVLRSRRDLVLIRRARLSARSCRRASPGPDTSDKRRRRRAHARHLGEARKRRLLREAAQRETVGRRVIAARVIAFPASINARYDHRQSARPSVRAMRCRRKRLDAFALRVRVAQLGPTSVLPPIGRSTSTNRCSRTGSTKTSTSGTLIVPQFLAERGRSLGSDASGAPVDDSALLSSVQKLPARRDVVGLQVEVDAQSLEHAAADGVAQRVVAEQRQVPGAAPRRDAGPTGTVRPHALSAARRSSWGIFAASSSLRPVSGCGRPPRPSTTARTIFELIWNG